MYLQLVLALALMVVVTGSPLSKADVKQRSKRLLGGTFLGKVPPSQYSFFTAISNKRYNAQGQLAMFHEAYGVVYNDQYIVTVAHALKPETVNREIFCGNTSRKVVKAIKHPDFNAKSLSPVSPNDVAILKLDAPLNGYCQPAVFPDPAVPIYSWTVTVPGFGYVWWSPAVKFVQVTLTALTRAQCQLVYGNYVDSNTQLCAWDANQAMCSGDGGTPGMVGNTVVGLGSWTDKDCKLPAVFTRMTYFIDWVRATVTADQLPSDPGNEVTPAAV